MKSIWQKKKHKYEKEIPAKYASHDPQIQSPITIAKPAKVRQIFFFLKKQKRKFEKSVTFITVKLKQQLAMHVTSLTIEWTRIC